MTDIPFAIVNNRGDRDPEYWKQLPWMIVKPARHWVGVATSRYIPMQYTGLKDAKGVEIYEGDVTKATDWDDEPREVVFWEGCFCHKRADGNGHIFDPKKVEIIGNIWENPELLPPIKE